MSLSPLCPSVLNLPIAFYASESACYFDVPLSSSCLLMTLSFSSVVIFVLVLHLGRFLSLPFCHLSLSVILALFQPVSVV